MAADEPLRGDVGETSIRDEISSEILAVHKESYGTGAEHIDVHLAEDLVVVIMDVELTAAERTLMEGGESEAVKRNREIYQDVIAPTFTAIVERATGRRVHGFLSALSIEPLYAVELFRLAPHAE